MKKTFIIMAVALGFMFNATSCGSGDKKSNDSANDTAVVETTMEADSEETAAEAEESDYKIPLTFTAERLTHYGGDEKLPLDTKIDPESDYTKTTFVFHIMSNGRYTATETKKCYNWRTKPNWGEEQTVNYEGKWETTSRTMGETQQKVYKLRMETGALDGWFYVPDNFEYVWQGADEWENGGNEWEDDNTKPVWAIQITKVENEK